MTPSTPKPPPGLPRWAKFLCALGALGAPCAARADQDLLSAASVGSGAAARADAVEVGVVLEAPATLALEDRYDVVGGARLAAGKDFLWQVAARDSHTSPISLGLAFCRWTATPPTDPADLPGWATVDDDLDNPVVNNTLAVGLAGSWLDRRLAVGISGVRYAESSRFGGDSATYDLGFSVAGRPAAPLSLSLGALHWVDLFKGGETDHAFTAGAGAVWQVAKPVRALLDVASPLLSAAHPVTLHGGLEALLVKDQLALRLGAQRDGSLGTTFLTTGVGLRGGQVSLDYALRVDVGADGGAVDQTGARVWNALSLQLRIPEF